LVDNPAILKADAVMMFVNGRRAHHPGAIRSAARLTGLKSTNIACPYLLATNLALTRSLPRLARVAWMGEVYRAKDTKLDRAFAIEVLP